MQKSDSIANIAAALSIVQGKIRGAEKDCLNPHFGKRYSSLDAIWDSIRGPMSEVGLSVTQPLSTDANGKMTLVTILMHKSGEFISSEQPLIMAKTDPQGVVAATSYARRNALSALVGQTSETDDDGEEASGRGKKPAAPPQAAKPQSKAVVPHVSSRISEGQLKRLFAIQSEAGVPDEALKEICAEYGIFSRKDISTTHYDEIIQRLQAAGIK